MRAATVADVEAIMALETTIFPDDAWSTEQMLQGITSPFGHYVVCEKDGAIIAYAGAFHLPDDDVADIHTIGVATDARGNGVGAELFDDLVAWAKRDGAKRILLEVRADNLVAQNLYQSRGFQTIAIRERYYQPANVDALIMEQSVA
ncbi:MAG: ribosomal protein S18-alanine N-acetyltransferase [Microbacteriaceae bacterium]